MKKFIKFTGLALAAACVLGATACGGETLKIGKEYLEATSQLDALTKLDTGAADVAIIDSVMAGYYTSTGEYADKMQMVEGLVLAEEQYGIAGRKGEEAFLSEINKAIIAMNANGSYGELTAEWGLTASNAITAETTNPYANATDNSWEKIKTDGKIVVGYTVFAPIAITDSTAKDGLTGFDIEFARAVVDYLNTTYSINLTVEFTEIDWNTKESLLANGAIDLIWNGMTITDDRAAQMCISIPYLLNKQVAVIMKTDAATYTNKESMANAIMCAEGGSAGETVICGEKK